ncbi:MAG: hypothetical protein ABUK01_11420 [Leptospirales bacterium]
MNPFKFPPAFYGLSRHEKTVLEKLPWKIARVKDVESKEVAFFVRNGRIKSSDNRLIGDCEELLGVIPFCENTRQKYEEVDKSEVVYILTSELAKFFLRYPKAMQSFIKMHENKGRNVLSRWKDFSRVWSFISQDSSWQTLHTACQTGRFLTDQAKQSCLFLEFQAEGLSIFSLLDSEIPPALLQRDENEVNLKDILKKRIKKINGLDTLNIQHLSYWKMTRAQWASLFLELQSKYKNLIVHMGESPIEFLMEESDAIFLFKNGQDIKTTGPSNAHLPVLMPLCREIQTDQKTPANGQIPYPLDAGKLVDVKNLPKTESLDDKYWEWLHKHIGSTILRKDAAVISGAEIQNETEILNAEKQLPFLKEKSFSQDTLVIAESTTSLSAYLANSEYTDELTKNIKSESLTYDLIKNLKPVFPESGFYSSKTFYKFFGKKMRQEYMGVNKVVFVGFDYKNETVCLFSRGKVLDNLEQSMFPPGILDNSASHFAVQKKNRAHLLAYLFRYGLNKVNFYELETEKPSPKKTFLHTLLGTFYGIKNETVNIGGMLASHNNIIITENQDESVESKT